MTTKRLGKVVCRAVILRNVSFYGIASKIDARLEAWRVQGVRCPCCRAVGIIHAHKAVCGICGRSFWFDPFYDSEHQIKSFALVRRDPTGALGVSSVGEEKISDLNLEEDMEKDFYDIREITKLFNADHHTKEQMAADRTYWFGLASLAIAQQLAVMNGHLAKIVAMIEKKNQVHK